MKFHLLFFWIDLSGCFLIVAFFPEKTMENSLTFRKKADTSISVRNGRWYRLPPYSENSGFRIFPSVSTPNEILISLPDKHSIPTSAAKPDLPASR